MKIETGKDDPDHSPTIEDITPRVITICIEATLDHNTRIDAATTGAAHNDLAQCYVIFLKFDYDITEGIGKD